jgi:hypothetical protein
MTAPLDDLVATLATEAGEYRRLLPLLEEEAGALGRADAAALLEISARREAAIVRLTALERDRRAAIESLASALGVEPKAVTLSHLLDLVPSSAAVLAPLREEIRGLLGRLLRLNGRNRFLAEHTLGCLRGLFSNLVAALAPPPTYAESGRGGQPVQELQLLDRRA